MDKGMRRPVGLEGGGKRSLHRFPPSLPLDGHQMKIRPTMQERVEISKKATISTM
jgi:hypothetical protein